MDDPLTVAKEHPQHFPVWFINDLPELIPVYRVIEAEALKLARVREKYAIDNVVADIRWDTVLSEPGGFKMNNDHRAYYARLFHLMHPTHRIFRMRITGIERQHGVLPPL